MACGSENRNTIHIFAYRLSQNRQGIAGTGYILTLQKGVVVIPGSSNPDHIQENTELFDFALTDDEMARIYALNRGEKHDWY